MNRRRLFELNWAEIERELSLGEASTEDLPAGVREPLLVATALRQAGGSVMAPDTDAAWLTLARSLDADAAPVRRLPVRRPVVSRPRLIAARTLAAVAAAFVALAAISANAAPGSPLYSVRRGIEATVLVLLPDDGGLHGRLASARLDDLVHTLEQGPVGEAPGVARTLVTERAAALQAGVDVSELDRGIASEVPPALAKAPAEVSAEIEAILGSLLPPSFVEQVPGSDTSGAVSPGGTGAQGGSSEGGGGSSDPGGSGDTQSSGSGDSGDPQPSGGDSQGAGGSTDPTGSTGSTDPTGSTGSTDPTGSTGSTDPTGSGSGSDSSGPDPSAAPSSACDTDPCGGA